MSFGGTSHFKTMMRSLDGIESLTIDFDRDELRVVRKDGRAFVQDGVGRPIDGPYDFNSVTFRPADLLLELVVPSGDRLEVEVYADDDQRQRRAGRPVIYLDQNKWVQIARAIHRPGLVPQGELDPTLSLIELAKAKKVILPISSGHWIETGSTYGERRVRLATSVVSLSRGWIMRDPLRIAAWELESVFADPAREAIEEPEVFTRRPQRSQEH